MSADLRPQAQAASCLRQKTVAVVGAGLSGLRAATALTAAGVRVVVIEARDEVGGKVALREEHGFSVDRSLQILNFEDANLLRFTRELGLGSALLPLRSVVSAQLHRGRIVPCDARSLAEISRLPGVTLRDRLRLLRLPRLMRRYAALLDPLRPELAAALDFRSVADWAKLYLGESVLERFVAPRISAETGGDEYQLSRAAFLLHWQQSGCGGSRLGIAAAGLGTLAEAAARTLELRSGVRAEQLKELSDGRLALECSGGAAAGRDEILEIDALVLATSAAEAGRVAASLVTPPERDFLAGMRFGPRVTLSVATDRPLTGLPEFVRIPHAEGCAIEAMLVEPGVPGGRAPEGCGLVTLSATQRFAEQRSGEDDDLVERALLSSLASILPRAAGTRRWSRLHRDPAAVPRFEVGAYNALARFQRVQRDRCSIGRRLYFAGDYLAGPRHEDAIVSGTRAAAAAVTDLSQQT